MNTLDQIRASAKQQHGYDVGESGAMVLAVLSDHMNEHRRVIEEATVRINTSTRPFQSNDPKAAFWHGVGRGAPWAVVGLVAVGLLGFFYRQSVNYQNQKVLLDQYPNSEAYRFLMQDGQMVKQPNGWTELMLTPTPGPNETMAGKHYRYDKARKRVYVPLLYIKPKSDE